MAHDEPWYLDAVLYVVDVKRYADGNGDGIGDFVGLTDKVRYLAELGVTCIWLSPFFPTPGRDNGYDVSDYCRVDPALGTTEDFLAFLHAAGERGIRVIIDLVVNHTSDKHPWFEAARRDENSRFRQYYVWSKEPPPVAQGDTSVFPDDEPTVWTYDEVAHAYYFHKFYAFQPDLNTGNPAVIEEIEKVMDHWLALGVAGFRLDAIPFVVGENGLQQADPESPQELMQRLNAYFGQGDQLGLLFNFLTPCYVFAGLATENAARISEALDLLPEPPPDCGWANFLRNLDELDYSQVPEHIKEEAFTAFAKDPGMIVHNRGIRRRIAPMLGGNMNRIAMALSLMFSLPGAPVLVYGDEIGMGDDLDQPDRISVRTPMQWTGGKNGGFSKAAPGKLIQPAVDTGPFSYKKVNVEEQDKNPISLLSRIRALIAARRKVSSLLRGRTFAVSGNNDAVHARCVGDGVEFVMAVHNLSGHNQEIDLRFGEHFEAQMSDLLGSDTLSVHDKITLSLPAYGYRWLRGTKVHR